MNQFYIDKTEELQKGIEGFPSIYIEGFAACGKSVAVRMLLERYPEAESTVIDVAQKSADEAWNLESCLSNEAKNLKFVIFENMNTELSDTDRHHLTAFLNQVPEKVRVIFVSREHPDKCLLPYLWKRQMEIIPQEAFLLSRSEIQNMITEMKCDLNAGEVYAQTGGWAGCVDMMLRLAKRVEKYTDEKIDAKRLRQNYEIEQYIQYTIMDSLEAEEKEFLQKCIFAPWVNENLCQELFGIENAQELLRKLRRKGIFKYDSYQEKWLVMEAFRRQKQWETEENWKKMSRWYAGAGYIREATACIRNAKDEEAYLNFLQKYYAQIELSDIPGEMILSKKRISPEMCYLQGLYNYLHQDFTGLDREIVRLEKMDVTDTHQKYEILLNLYYLKPDFSLENWMNLLVKYGEMYAGEQKFKLYHMLGYSHTYLCGLRDLTGLFACLKKEENQHARHFKAFLTEDEWKCYQLAKIDYYLETERQDKINDDEWAVLYEKNDEQREMNIARLYLAGKLMRIDASVENEEHFLNLSKKMKGHTDEANVINSIIRLYSRWTKESHLMTYWLRYSENMARAEISEQNYIELCFMMKGYLQLNQYEKAERIVRKMIPYLQKYHRSTLLTEAHFQQAIVSWEMDRHGQALQNVIESFLVGAPYRYVGFYTNYGAVGEEVLEAYEEWCRTNLPEKWRRKKKYQYGNVLRMPEADYVGVILRIAHKERNAGLDAKTRAQDTDMISVERLTMMETMVLQAIGRGCSNAEICEELNLKLPTVKTHIYSMYKKLGVSGRVQAVNKGKEMGML